MRQSKTTPKIKKSNLSKKKKKKEKNLQRKNSFRREARELLQYPPNTLYPWMPIWK